MDGGKCGNQSVEDSCVLAFVTLNVMPGQRRAEQTKEENSSPSCGENEIPHFSVTGIFSF